MSSEETESLPEQRELGRAVAETPHSDLSTELVERFGAELDAIGRALDDDPAEAGRRLRAFWDGYVTASLPASETPASTPGARLEQAFRADVLGMDLYQVLGRLYDRLADHDGGDPDPDGVGNWSRRAHDLTREHHRHLQGHLH